MFADNVSTLVPVVGFGLNDAPIPFGRPDSVSWTLPANPFCGITVIVDVLVPPCSRLTVAGALMMKLSEGVTVRVR